MENISERHAQRWAFDAVSDHDLDEAAHYCRYAFAAYGYLLYIWAQPQYKSASLHCSSSCLHMIDQTAPRPLQS